MNVRRTLGRVAIAGLTASIGLVATGAVLAPASADAPAKVAWWNFVPAGSAAPAPDAPDGGMRVSVASSQVGSYGALQLAVSKDGGGTLTLKVAQMSGSSSEQLNKILACPTKGNAWKEGGDQDGATAPGYDCEKYHFVGKLDAAGATYTFLVDGSADVTDGVLSLAIVPEQTTGAPVVGTDTGLDVTPPFVVDFAKPDSDSFTVTSGSSSSSGGSTAPPPPPTPTSTGTGSTGPSGGGTTAPSLPSDSGSVSAPTTPDAGQTPVVAGDQSAQQQPQATTPIAAQAAQSSTGTDDNKRNILFLLLGALAFAFLYTQNQQNAHTPRALVGPNAQSADDPALAAAAAAGLMPARGLGRFNRPRSGPARPLI